MVTNKITDPSGLAGAAGSTPKTEDVKKPQLGQQEFLTLLVEQLKHQDPLNPMNNEEFAVQLAQFSSLEQLIDINSKIDKKGEGDGASSIGTLASFLGNEVLLADQQAQISDGIGPNVILDIPPGAQSGRIDFKNAENQVVGTIELGSVEAGRQIIKLRDVEVPNGAYSLRAVVVNGEGGFTDLQAKVTGTVEGFVVEPEPALIVNGEQLPLSGVKEVYAGQGMS